MIVVALPARDFINHSIQGVKVCCDHGSVGYRTGQRTLDADPILCFAINPRSYDSEVHCPGCNRLFRLRYSRKASEEYRYQEQVQLQEAMCNG